MVKVGDKIKVVNTEWTPVPNGSIMTVIDEYNNGCVEAKMHGGDGFEWYMRPDTYEPYEPLKIEAGKYYKTRDGRKVGPMMPTDHGGSSVWQWEFDELTYRDDGTWDFDRDQSNNDLIEEWQDEPASEVTPDPTQIDTLESLAAKHGICITVTTGDLSITLDGRPNLERST